MLKYVGRPCAYCGTTMTSRGSSGDFPTRDHFVPKKLGGRKVVAACCDCNRAKSALLPGQFYDQCVAVSKGAAYFAKKQWGWFRIKAARVVQHHSRESIFNGELDRSGHRHHEYVSFKWTVVDLLGLRSISDLSNEEQRIVATARGKKSPRQAAEEILSARG